MNSPPEESEEVVAFRKALLGVKNNAQIYNQSIRIIVPGFDHLILGAYTGEIGRLHVLLASKCDKSPSIYTVRQLSSAHTSVLLENNAAALKAILPSDFICWETSGQPFEVSHSANGTVINFDGSMILRFTATDSALHSCITHRGKMYKCEIPRDDIAEVVSHTALAHFFSPYLK